MRFSIIYGAAAAAIAAAASGDAADSMCVMGDGASGMLFEMPCDVLPLRKKDASGIGQAVSMVFGEAKTEIKRDAPSTDEVSAASVLASKVSATNLWPTGVHPFMAPTPIATPASDCVNSLADEFAMIVISASSAQTASATKRATSDLNINLVNGTIIDSLNRIGSIVSNRQLQFDAFGQAGSIYTAGFQACGPPNARLLALGGNTVWYGCVSGSFMNLYDQNIAPQCKEVQLLLVNILQPGGDLNGVDGPLPKNDSPVSVTTTTLSNGKFDVQK